MGSIDRNARTGLGDLSDEQLSHLGSDDELRSRLLRLARAVGVRCLSGRDRGNARRREKSRCLLGEVDRRASSAEKDAGGRGPER
jgi:hypothetical protein